MHLNLATVGSQSEIHMDASEMGIVDTQEINDESATNLQVTMAKCHEEAVVLYKDVNELSVRLSRSTGPIRSASLRTDRGMLISVSGAPPIQLLSLAGDPNAMMRCPCPPTKWGSVTLGIDDEGADIFFGRLDAHVKQELLRPEISDLTKEDVEAGYNPMYQRQDMAFPGNIRVMVDPRGSPETMAYTIVEWGDGVLRHAANGNMTKNDKLSLMKKDAQVVVAVVRLDNINVKRGKDGGVVIYPNMSLAGVAVYAPRDQEDDDPFT